MNRRWLVVAVGVSLVASVSGGAVGAVPARAASVRECDVTGESDRFPVVLIHGFATKSEKIARDWKPASDAITAAGGQPVLFDWAGESWDWVTKKGAEKRLRSSIECLAAKAGGPVFVVAHSMGGLLLRAAFQDGLDTRLVAGAVTIGTPHEGIWLDQTGMEVVKAAIAGVCLGSLVGLAVCAGPLGGQVTNLFSGAVAGMTAGSTELNQLKPWPDSVPATFIAGELTLCNTTFLLELGCENIGRDPLVKVDSALASTTVSAPNISRVTIKCKTSWAHFIADLPTDLDHVPCSHGPLRRQPETLTAITTMVDRKACTARNLFAAAVAKEQIDPNDPAYEALLEYGEGPQASDVICNADWATATVSRPQVGTTDGTTLFHLGNDNIWTEVAIIGNPVVDCRLVAEGVPPDIASILAPTDAQFLADNPGICPGTTALTPDPMLGNAATGGAVDTPIGRVRLLPRPSPGDCSALEGFGFDEIAGLDTSGWDNRDLGVTVYGFEPATRSIDLEFSAFFGLYIIRDGELLAHLVAGDRVDDAVSRRRWDTSMALYPTRPGEPAPALLVEGGAAGGGIRPSTTPTVANCMFNEDIFPEGGE